MTCSKNIVSWIWNLLLRRLTASPCLTHCCSTVSTITWCSALVLLPQMRILLKYQMHPSISLKIVSIISWNNTWAFVRPNDITVYLKSPYLVQKAVFHSSPAAILMRLYLFFGSHLVNHFPLLVLSSSSLMSGRGYLLDIVRRFRAL